MVKRKRSGDWLVVIKNYDIAVFIEDGTFYLRPHIGKFLCQTAFFLAHAGTRVPRCVPKRPLAQTSSNLTDLKSN